MAKYYEVNSIATIKAALLDYYGAYDASTNPDGVDVKTDSTTLLIFSCTAISDKVIKFTGYDDLRAFYGDEYSSGDITNPIEFGGSSTSGTTSIGHLVCADNTCMLNFLVSTISSRLWIIGQLTDGQFAVCGYVGSSSSTYNANTRNRITADSSVICIGGLNDHYSVGSKIAKAQTVVYIQATGALYSGSAITGIKDVYSVSKKLGGAVVSKGTGYFMTTSNMYNADGDFLGNSLMMEVTN